MDIYQIIITYYPIWSPFEWIIFLSVLALAVCIAVVLYKKQKITMRQSIAGILLLLYLSSMEWLQAQGFCGRIC